ncbi:hypothetical protein C8R44DRAFT_606318 [Mycena epipterygia]|nr:hypothetical protein C8R44DRAFT_606318 [Mycena epipterygia]
MEVETAGTAAPPKHFFRCADCDMFLQCQDCCIARHALSPFHIVEEWVNNFWKRRTLKALSAVYQLGHGGFKCRFPDPMKWSLTVTDGNAIHEIHYRFCGCDRSDKANNLVQFMRNWWYPASNTDPDTCTTFGVLDFFRLLNVVRNMNARDFITALERRMDATAGTGLKWLLDRYKAFLRMSRQWAFLQRLRRAGRGHDPAGIKATKPGEVMVVCWACPYNGRNLPANWRDIDPKYRYLFRLILAMDTNFKMKNRIRAREHDDPLLGPGWGTFVEPTKYKKHLRKYVAEKDISTCIVFAALTQKDTRNTAGLRVSGVGGCVCACHECMRANGLGDLQKGERYANMDYILMSALQGFDLAELTLSYDIACQWKINFAERMAKLPAHLQLELDNILLETGLPVWHALVHEDFCASLNSLNYIRGVGRSDGEGVERLWAFLNLCSYQSKEMGLGNCVDTIEDKLDSHNHQKNIGQANSLRRKLIVAIAEHARQVMAFKEINKCIEPELREDWQTKIDAFTADHTAPNPYILSNNKGPTEAQIRLSLRNEEQRAAKDGQAPLHATSTTVFLSGGLQLEETQYAEMAGRSLTADRQGKIEEHRMAFMAKLRKFRELQSVYTPGAVQAMEKEEGARDAELAPPTPENVYLWLPSELTRAERAGSGCQRNVADMEATMREGQCENTLLAIRRHLHVKRFLISFRNANITGQAKATRSHTIIDQLEERIDVAARKYQAAHTALLRLKGADYVPHLKALNTSDLILEGEEARDPGEAAKSDRAAMKKLGRIGRGRNAQNLCNDALSKKAPGVSWIWVARGTRVCVRMWILLTSSWAALRVEWSRAKARKSRWDEEVELLCEEMRRVMRYLEWEAMTWDARAVAANERTNIAADTRQGCTRTP